MSSQLAVPSEDHATILDQDARDALALAEPLQRLIAGDKPGHSFRGNQWGPGRRDTPATNGPVLSLDKVKQQATRAGYEVHPDASKMPLEARAWMLPDGSAIGLGSRGTHGGIIGKLSEVKKHTSADLAGIGFLLSQGWVRRDPEGIARGVIGYSLGMSPARPALKMLDKLTVREYSSGAKRWAMDVGDSVVSGTTFGILRDDFEAADLDFRKAIKVKLARINHPSLRPLAERLAAWLDADVLTAGDRPGHQFHGNQWTGHRSKTLGGIKTTRETVAVGDNGNVSIDVPHPSMLQADYPDLEKRHGREIATRVAEFEDRYRAAPIEHLMVLGMDGAELVNKSGNISHVGLSENEIRELKYARLGHGGISIITHNHPVHVLGDDAGFSPGDVGTALGFGAKELRVVTLFSNRSLVRQGGSAPYSALGTSAVVDRMWTVLDSQRKAQMDAYQNDPGRQAGKRNPRLADDVARVNNVVMDRIMQVPGINGHYTRTELQSIYDKRGRRRLRSGSVPAAAGWQRAAAELQIPIGPSLGDTATERKEWDRVFAVLFSDPEPTQRAGDTPGHPFRGNQWTTRSGAKAEIGYQCSRFERDGGQIEDYGGRNHDPTDAKIDAVREQLHSGFKAAELRLRGGDPWGRWRNRHAQLGVDHMHGTLTDLGSSAGHVVEAHNRQGLSVGAISYEVGKGVVLINMLGTTGELHGTGSALMRHAFKAAGGTRRVVIPWAERIAHKFYRKMGGTANGSQMSWSAADAKRLATA